MSREIRVPANGWRPRPYQRRLWDYFERGGKRACCVWHRRAGKDEVLLHLTAAKAMLRPATYWYMLPEAAQARKAIWEAVNPHTGRRRIDEAFPAEIRQTVRENEMFMRFVNGSTWQVVGSDNYNSLIGSPPAGLVFSEYSIANPSAWDILRPILAENEGWAAFNYTPRGPNHGETLYEAAKADPMWFAERLTVADTNVFSEERLRQELKELVANNGDHGRALYEQEYYCSFLAAVVGAYFGREMQAAEDEGRILERAVYDPGLQVHTAWDLGISNYTVIWFYQQAGFETRIVDCYAAMGYGLDHYAGVLQGKGYRYGNHYLPHDVAPKELGTGRTRIETLASLGINANVVPMLPVEDGINAVRRILPRCWFDRDKCAEGIKALKLYRRQWDDVRKVFYERPMHDWTSDFADAFRYLAIGLQEPRVAVNSNYPRRELSWVI
jgi:phage terminase large subunit